MLIVGINPLCKQEAYLSLFAHLVEKNLSPLIAAGNFVGVPKKIPLTYQKSLTNFIT
jgi:hypothetical protein